MWQDSGFLKKCRHNLRKYMVPAVMFCAVMVCGVRVHRLVIHGPEALNLLWAAVPSSPPAGAPATSTAPASSTPPTSNSATSPNTSGNSGAPKDDSKGHLVPIVDGHVSGAQPSFQETFDPLNLTDAEYKMLMSLATRQEELKAREAKLTERETLLQVVEKRIEEKSKELGATKQALEDTLRRYDAFSEHNNKRLIKIYETMPAKRAALILASLEMNDILSVLNGMKEKSASAIIELLDPRQAQALTVALIQRSSLGKKKN